MPEEYSRDNYVVLVVDDDPMTLKICSKILVSAGYNVVLANDGSEALQILRRSVGANPNGSIKSPSSPGLSGSQLAASVGVDDEDESCAMGPIDLVITDIHMPTTSGIELLSMVRNDERLAHVKVIIMGSAVLGSFTVDNFIRDGCEDYIVKPLRKHVMLKKVDDLMKAKYSERLQAEVRAHLRRKEIENKRLRSTLAAASAADTVTKSPAVTLLAEIRQVLDKEPQLSRLAPDLPNRLRMVSDLLAHGEDIYTPQWAPSTGDVDEVFSSWLQQYGKLSVPQGPGAPGDSLRSLSAQFALQGGEQPRSSPGPLPRVESGSANDNSIPLPTLTSWSFDATLFSRESYVPAIITMFEYYKLLDKFGISRKVMRNFLTRVLQTYVDNPYHNAMHSFDVVQATFCLLVTYQADRLLKRLEIFALLIAAVGHDCGHPGTNNQFQIKARSDIALVYNDTSVLENFHAATIFRVARLPNCDIFAGMSEDEFERTRTVILRSVLATDLANHLEHVAKFDARMLNAADNDDGYAFLRDDPQDREDLCCMLLKLADISNVARPWEIARKWNALVAEEFFLQGDLERERGFPVTPHLDRDRIRGTQITINFIDFIASDFVHRMSEMLQGSATELVAYCNQCREELVTLSEEQQYEPAITRSPISVQVSYDPPREASHSSRKHSAQKPTIRRGTSERKNSGQHIAGDAVLSLDATGGLASSGLNSSEALLPMEVDSFDSVSGAQGSRVAARSSSGSNAGGVDGGSTGAATRLAARSNSGRGTAVVPASNGGGVSRSKAAAAVVVDPGEGGGLNSSRKIGVSGGRKSRRRRKPASNAR